jgi:para-nitrobenzyl esterase
MVFQDNGASEDCLFLNVYTPVDASDKSKLPVMFWIHGGGYSGGGSNEPRHNGDFLPLKGVVLVTINYRLGVFGFLATSDLAKVANGSAGNYGLMDMVSALQWVKENIAQFGGDPQNVTIFGESAGSFAVSTLMASPMAKGLFQKAIGESGGAVGRGVLNTDTLAEREVNGSRVPELPHWPLCGRCPLRRFLMRLQRSREPRFRPTSTAKCLPNPLMTRTPQGSRHTYL